MCWICEKWVEQEFIVNLDEALLNQNMTRPNG